MARRNELFNRLARFFLGATGFTCLCYLLLLVIPPSNNPIARPEPEVMVFIPTATATPTGPTPTLAPTRTPTPRLTNTPVIKGTPTPPGPSDTPRPTYTRPPSRTPLPTDGPSPTPSPTRSKYPFTAEIYGQLSPFGCNWAGLMGVVIDLEGNHVPGYIVHVEGDADIDRTITAGSSQFKNLPEYGPSAWDISINASGLTAGTWRVRLYKPGSNAPYSDVYEIRLEASCGLSSMFVKFVQNHEP